MEGSKTGCIGLNWSCFMHICVWKGECDLWKSVLYALCYLQNDLRASSSFGRLARLATKAFLKNLSESRPLLFFPHFLSCMWTSQHAVNISCQNCIHSQLLFIVGLKIFHIWLKLFLSSRSAFLEKVPSLFLHFTCKIPDTSISTWQSETNAVAAKDCDLWQSVLCQSLLSDRNFIAPLLAVD